MKALILATESTEATEEKQLEAGCLLYLSAHAVTSVAKLSNSQSVKT